MVPAVATDATEASCLSTSSSTAQPRRPRVVILVENLSVPSDRRVWQESLATTGRVRTLTRRNRLSSGR
jgi:hypothetical protein